MRFSVFPFLMIALGVISCTKPKATLLYVGTYSANNSEGIYCYNFEEGTGDLTLLAVTPNQENPSFLAISPNNNFLYAVSEVKKSPQIDSGSVTAYRIQDMGRLEKINQEATRGNHPCHVAVSPNGKFVVASNYTSGSLSFFHVEKNGALSESFQKIQHVGSGPNQNRQQSPHTHSSLFTKDGKLLVSADLGTDKIEFYRFDETVQQFKEAEQVFISMEPGAGPRHFAFSPDEKFIYVMNEMHSTVTVLQKNTNGFEILETVSTLPENYTGDNSGADIHVSADGKFVYASNRGLNSIAVFQRGSDGRLTLIENEPVLGEWPRNFAISPDGSFLLVANQHSNNISAFKIDPTSGKLDFTGQSVEVPNPVCLKFLVP